MKTVAKFGGSSVRDADAIQNCCHIISSFRDITLVVVSATCNTTNQLEDIAALSVKSISEANLELDRLFKRHESIAQELSIHKNTLSEFFLLKKEGQSLIRELSEQGSVSAFKMDQMYSLGERISKLLVTGYLQEIDASRGPRNFDIRNILITNDCFGLASPLLFEIHQKGQSYKALFEKHLIITQGFIGMTAEGQTTTLGREGSDYSATLLAEAFDAHKVQIWTDVEGVFTADPKILKSAKKIDKMSYQEASLMAENGAKVLFSKTLAPAQRKKIPVFVKSSLRPSSEGTMISSERGGPFFAIGLTMENEYLNIIGLDLYKKEEVIEERAKKMGGFRVGRDQYLMKYKFSNLQELKRAFYDLHKILFYES